MQGNDYNDTLRNLTWIRRKMGYQENENTGSKFLVGQRITGIGILKKISS